MQTPNVMKMALAATSSVMVGTMALAGTASASEPTVFDQEPAGYEPSHVATEFEPAAPGVEAMTYDEELVPAGSNIVVWSMPSPAGTTTVLQVDGLQPDREYGAHVHTQPCGTDPDDAGPHFQNVPDPVQPSVDPAYANPRNEIWLDFTTNAQGGAWSGSWVSWRIGDRQAGSVVIHERHTSTGPGEAGEAGERLACVNVPFEANRATAGR